VVYVPDSVVYHRFGGTTGSEIHTPRRVFCGTRNSIFNIVKNYELQNIPFPLFFNFFYHFGKLLLFLFTLRVESALAILKAYGSFLKNILRIIKKRREVQRKRKIEDDYMFDNSLIVNFTAMKKEFIRLRKALKQPMF
jgi:GT2 family glycosyltransferase